VWWRGEVDTGLWWGTPEGKRTLGNPGVVGRIILKWIFRKWVGGTDRIELAQNRDRWQAFAKAEMDLRFL